MLNTYHKVQSINYLVTVSTTIYYQRSYSDSRKNKSKIKSCICSLIVQTLKWFCSQLLGYAMAVKFFLHCYMVERVILSLPGWELQQTPTMILVPL